jgi:hypothetical protein
VQEDIGTAPVGCLSHHHPDGFRGRFDDFDRTELIAERCWNSVMVAAMSP